MPIPLPNEIFLEIFSTIDPQHDKATLFTLRFLNRRICELVTPFAFKTVYLQTSLEDTLLQAWHICTHPHLAKYIQEVHISHNGIIAKSDTFRPPAGAIFNGIYFWSGWMEQQLAFSVCLWNILDIIPHPLRVFTMVAEDLWPDPKWKHDERSIDISSRYQWYLSYAIQSAFTNQANKYPQRIQLKMARSGEKKIEKTELFWLTDQPVFLARLDRDLPFGHVGEHTGIHLPDSQRTITENVSAHHRVAKPYQEFLPKLFNAVGITFNKDIMQQPVYRAPVSAVHQNDLYKFNERQLAFGKFAVPHQGIRPTHLNLQNIIRQHGTTSDFVMLFEAQDRLRSLTLKNCYLYMTLREDEDEEICSWATILKTVRSTARNLVKFRMHQCWVGASMDTCPPVEGLPNLPLITHEWADLVELIVLCNVTAVGRREEGLPVDPWLDWARETPQAPKRAAVT